MISSTAADAPFATATTPIKGAALPKPNEPIMTENNTTKTVPLSISPWTIKIEPYLKFEIQNRKSLDENRFPLYQNAKA